MKFSHHILLSLLIPFAFHSSLTAADKEDVPAFAKDARILFQGDSITDGNRGRGADPNHILGHGYAFIIAAKYGASLAERNLNFMNRGISGNTVLDLEKRWTKDTIELKPDILSILIGVNDKGRNVPFEQFEQVYDKLLTDAKTANPNLKLVLCEPFVLNHLATTPSNGSPNADIVKRQEIVAKLAKKHGAALVHFQKALDEASKRAPVSHWIWDDVHPTYSGHQVLADEWERVVKAFWKESK